MTTPGCEGCATRGHLYINGCKRCEARMLARAPRRLLRHDITPELTAMIEDERERDALADIPA
jgi:hypothetical protein